MRTMEGWSTDFPDGEATSEMDRTREEERARQDAEERRNSILWEKYVGHFGRDGSLVIPLPKAD